MERVSCIGGKGRQAKGGQRRERWGESRVLAVRDNGLREGKRRQRCAADHRQSTPGGRVMEGPWSGGEEPYTVVLVQLSTLYGAAWQPLFIPYPGMERPKAVPSVGVKL